LTQPITLGVVIETKELWQEVQACLQGLNTRILLEQAQIGDWTAFLEKLERLRPDALLVDFTRLQEPYEGLIARIKETTVAPQVVAVHKSAEPETILTVIRAGADEYVYPPLASNLPRALERIAAGCEKQRQGAAKTNGKVYGFFSAKGGCGATTIACHAAVELARQTNQETLLADFDLDAGLIGFLMKSKSPYSVLDAMGNTHRLDVNYWRALISNGTPKLQVIRAPGVTVGREEPKQEDLRTVLRFVRFQYDWTIVDLGRGLNPLVLSGLEEVDEAFLVTTLDVPALHQVKQIVQTLLDNGYGRARLRMVLNRVPKSPDVMPAELEKLLGIPAYAMLPDDYASIYEAYAEGQLLSANTNLGRQLARLAAKIAGIPEQTGKKKFSIFGG
jgi:pilus assembly protein CpaE